MALVVPRRQRNPLGQAIARGSGSLASALLARAQAQAEAQERAQEQAVLLTALQRLGLFDGGQRTQREIEVGPSPQEGAQGLFGETFTPESLEQFSPERPTATVTERPAVLETDPDQARLMLSLIPGVPEDTPEAVADVLRTRRDRARVGRVADIISQETGVDPRVLTESEDVAQVLRTAELLDEDIVIRTPPVLTETGQRRTDVLLIDPKKGTVRQIEGPPRPGAEFEAITLPDGTQIFRGGVEEFRQKEEIKGEVREERAVSNQSRALFDLADVLHSNLSVIPVGTPVGATAAGIAQLNSAVVQMSNLAQSLGLDPSINEQTLNTVLDREKFRDFAAFQGQRRALLLSAVTVAGEILFPEKVGGRGLAAKQIDTVLGQLRPIFAGGDPEVARRSAAEFFNFQLRRVNRRRRSAGLKPLTEDQFGPQQFPLFFRDLRVGAPGEGGEISIDQGSFTIEGAREEFKRRSQQ